jgi:nucleoid DNA-binding protein
MATKKSTAAKAAPVTEANDAPAAEPSDGTTAAPRTKAPSLRIKTLVDRVAETTGGKKKGVKEIVEATLTALGEALAKGEDLNLPGFGRTRIARSMEKDGASHMTLKVRRGPHKKKDTKEPLADEEDDG